VVRVNLGCGQAYMDGWVNVDASTDVKADIYLDAADFVRQYGDEVSEVYMGHVLEHILPGDALVTLRLLCERLPKGAVVSAVTPDMVAIWEAYQQGEISNEQLNASFVYSYMQPSHHVWCYDTGSLTELFRRAGFDDVEPIDPLAWAPVFHKEGTEARWQCGVKATAKGEPVKGDRGVPPQLEALTFETVLAEQKQRNGGKLPVTTEHLLLRRVEVLREALLHEARRLADAEQQLAQGRKAAQPPAPVQPPAPGQPPAPALPPAPRPTVARPAPEPLPAAQPAPEPRPAAPAAAGIKGRIKQFTKQRLPEGSKSREIAKAGLRVYREARVFGQRVKHASVIPGVLEPREPSYTRWLRRHQPSQQTLAAQGAFATRTSDTKEVHVLVLPGPGPLKRTLASLVEQSWPHWAASVCLPGQRSRDSSDPRIAAAAESGSPVDTANAAVTRSDQDFVVILRSGDRLSPDCLYSVVTAARQDPLVDLVVWDDDLVDGRGHRRDPRFRPSWSPEMLLGANYIGRSFAIRRRRYLFAGGLRNDFGDALEWDLLLRSGLDDERVARVPRVLGSVADRPRPAGDVAVRAVGEHLQRLGWPARAEADGDMVRVRWELPEWPRVTVLIPTRHNRPVLSSCLPSLARTDYPQFDVVIVDNGGRSDENQRWYADNAGGLDLQVLWWDKQPFNYSEVNNAAAAKARGEVLVFLNDDTEILDPSWMKELVGWATRPEIGIAGLQLVGPDGKLQHAGAVLGLNGFADHVFEGMAPGSDSIFGSTRWYRDVLAVTAACMAVQRRLYEELGGMDERFILCGSDVALGLDTTLKRLHNVCSPYARVRHLESATRGTNVPRMDFFTSYWRYNPWLIGGDPYFSPNLSLGDRKPALRSRNEPTPQQRIAVPLGRQFQVFRQTNDAAEARMLADTCRALPVDEAGNADLHARNAAPFDVETVNWFIPSIDSPFYGGINTALRIADTIARNHGVKNRFVVWGKPHDAFVRSALTAAFPALADSEICFYADPRPSTLETIPEADVSIATLWVTAYAVAHFPNTRRKFYLIQDFEPMFYPAGTMYALAEETYRLGLYGLCNTENLLGIYQHDYGGKGRSFMPAVDQTVFHAGGRHDRTEDAPVTLFVYARPGHWRNCWELASLALEELKRRLGDRVRILTAGAWATGEGAARDIKHLGLLDYRATGELYRRSDVGLALTVSKHPSYLPIELMACGVPVVAFENPWGHWILRDQENCLLAKRTVDSLADRLERLCVDQEMRQRLAKRGLADIAAHHADWDKALVGIYPYLCDPEGNR
jgi:GT2 family glycosyltransferase/glycosyltransferase involved in cell wall biosynthesis/predicted SAM-dependent methyltransferase